MLIVRLSSFSRLDEVYSRQEPSFQSSFPIFLPDVEEEEEEEENEEGDDEEEEDVLDTSQVSCSLSTATVEDRLVFKD